MSGTGNRRRVLIASSHNLFREGLHSLLQTGYGARVQIVGAVSSTAEVLAALEAHAPDLVIVDYDDRAISRTLLLERFLEGQGKTRVVLLSLTEGGEVVAYDRRTLAATQMEDWLEAELQPPAPEQAPRGATPGIPPKKPRSANMKHFLLVGVLILLITAAALAGAGQINLLPVQASEEAAVVDGLFGLHIKVIIFLYALVMTFMLYSLVVFRRRKGETGDGEHFEGHTGLEVTWTILPLITVLYFSYLGGKTLRQTMAVEPDELQVRVTGVQWAWSFEYPAYGIKGSPELYLPVGRQAHFQLQSPDVIHSFWVPEFRLKQDVVPGLTTELRVKPVEPGEYKLRCAEMCGLNHAYMESVVRVVSQAEFDAWVQSRTGPAGEPSAARGEVVAKSAGCLACHSLDGSAGVGPGWLGLYGAQETLSDGSAVTVDEAYLHQAIVDPGAQVVQGFNNVMPPTFGQTLSEANIQDLIAYIKSLGK